MAKFTKVQRRALEQALYHLKRGREYLKQTSVVVAVRSEHATTTLHYTRGDGAVLYPIDKQIGSDLAGFDFAERELRRLLETEVRS